MKKIIIFTLVIVFIMTKTYSQILNNSNEKTRVDDSIKPLNQLIMSKVPPNTNPTQQIVGPAGTLVTVPNPSPQFLTCTVNGVVITTSGTQSWGYIPPTNPANATCLPLAPFIGLGNWTGSVGNAGFVRYTFSQPIYSARIGYTAANSFDIGTITINNSCIMQLSNPCGVDIIGTNVIDCNYLDGSGVGDVAITVASSSPFTTITLTNTSGTSGWVTANPCNFIINPITPITTTINNCSKINLDNFCYNATQAQTTTLNIFNSGCVPCTINGLPCSSSNVTIEPVTPLPFGCAFNPNGTVTIPAGTIPFDTHDQYYYKLRSIADPCITSVPTK